MPIITAQDIVKKALQKIGVLAEGETASAIQMNDGFDALNVLLDSWAGRSLLTTAQIRESFPLVPNQSTYTIGAVGTDFVTSKPFEIASAFVRDGNNFDYQIDVVSRIMYDSYGDKVLNNNTSRPTNLFYDPGPTQQTSQTGTIYLYPIPDATTPYTLYIESEKSFTEFASLTSTFTFPPSYKRAMIDNLAIELSVFYGSPITQALQASAQESMRIVENINSRNKKGIVGMDLPGSRKNYNIFSDEWD